MAQIHDRKSNFYSQKQSVRDELSAPQYLESAGDELIKILAKKQINTSTSLEEQLQTVQNFEKGFELNPESRKGITTLEDYKKHGPEEVEHTSTPSSEKTEKIQNVNDLMKITGLSRHELEVGLCEKPRSTVSHLYVFAIRNKRQKERLECLETKLPNHPINRLKEIEEECFGQMKKIKCETDSVTTETNPDGGVGKKSRRKKKHRKRKKKARGNATEDISKKPPLESQPQKNPIYHKDEEPLKASTSRVSLWDVKVMKKWSETKKIGCKPQAFYTIKNGKIIKLEKESGREDTT